jgi:hypothetical protein
MIRALVTGTLYATPEIRTGSSGKPFATCKILADVEGEKVFASVIAFGEIGEIGEEIARMKAKDAIGLSGKLAIRTYQGRDGQTRVSLSLTAEGVINLSPKPKKPRVAKSHPDFLPEAGDLGY